MYVSNLWLKSLILLTGFVGMQICFQYVNDQFFELTGHPRVPFEQLSWDQIVAEEDMVKVKHACSAITGGKTAEPVELKLKKTWIDQEGNRSEIWVQGSSYPEMDENGTVISRIRLSFHSVLSSSDLWQV